MSGKGPKKPVTFIKPPEPAFLKRLKEQAGYKEPATIETKRQKLENYADDDDEIKDDEKPMVVVLKPGDLTAEEAEKIEAKHTSDEGSDNKHTRHIFKKPEKKELSEKEKDKESKMMASKTKRIQNRSLLSFDEDDDDDDENV